MKNSGAWDVWVPKFFDWQCQTEATSGRYRDAWKWIAMWLQYERIHSPRQFT